MLIDLKCRVCNEVLPHYIRNEFDTLPPNTYLVECYGCGVLDIKLISKELISQGVNNL